MKTTNLDIGVVIAAIFLVLTLSSASLAQEIKLAAGVVPAENFAKIKGPFESATGLKLTVATKGAVGLLKDLDTGVVDASVAGMSFTDWMEVATREGYNIPDKNAYKHRVIGKDLIRVITHKDNPVKKLSKEQLKDIFSGKLVNWKNVGGKDQEIVLFRSTSMPGPLAIFHKQVMEGEQYAKTFKDVTTLEDVEKQVSQHPGATGLVSRFHDSVSFPEMPDVGRPITVVTKGAPSANLLKLLDFIRDEGPKYLSK